MSDYIGKLKSRGVALRQYEHYAAAKTRCEKFYLGRVNGQVLRRKHRTATQAEAYAGRAAARLTALRLVQVTDEQPA